MTSARRLHWKTLFMVSVMVVCATIGDFYLKRGMSQIGPVTLTPAGILHAFRLTVLSGAIWLAIFFLLGFMLSNMTVLSWADYSYVMPASAVGYIVVTFVAKTFLGETVSPLRWFGVTLIFAGVILVGRTNPVTSAVPARQAAS